MTEFTPVSSLLGGALIGLAATLLMILNGRVAGISGIMGGLLQPEKDETMWRVAFLVGLIAAPFLVSIFSNAWTEISFPVDLPTMIIAGVIVGYSTRLGGGCTSGHGICGISRLSARSITATLMFMATGFVTVYVVRHVGGL